MKSYRLLLRSFRGWETIPVVTVMRIACEIAIAVCLVFLVAATARQQDPVDPANSHAQAPTAGPPVSAEQLPKNNIPTPEKIATESGVNAAGKPRAKPAGAPIPPGNAKRRKATAPPPEDGPRKIVVRKGGAIEPAAQIAPGMTPEEAARQRRTTERLLAATDDQLQMLTAHTLGPAREETVGHIRNYMEHARLALKEGDLRRATTLAEKAHLLSDDLVRR